MCRWLWYGEEGRPRAFVRVHCRNCRLGVPPRDRVFGGFMTITFARMYPKEPLG